MLSAQHEHCRSNSIPSCIECCHEEPQRGNGAIPTHEDLGYGDEVPITLAMPAVPCNRSRLSRAVQIRNGPRLNSPCENEEEEEDDSYDDSSIDYTDSEDEEEESMRLSELQRQDEEVFLRDTLNDFGCLGVQYQRRFSNAGHTSLQKVSVQYEGLTEDTSCNPAQVNMVFRKGCTMPRRISMDYVQQQKQESGESSGAKRPIERRGSLEMSIGTSRLNRRRSTIAHQNQTRSFRGGLPAIPRSCSDKVGTTLLSSRPSRRESIDNKDMTGSGSEMSFNLSSSRPSSFSNKVKRRVTMDVTTPGDDPKEQRRVSMNLTESCLPRSAPTPKLRRGKRPNCANGPKRHRESPGCDYARSA